MHEIVVYTAIFGASTFSLCPVKHTDVPHVCYTDTDGEENGWIVRRPSRRYRDGRLEAKEYKLQAHIYVDSRHSIWVDASTSLLKHPAEFVKCLGEDKSLAVFRHPGRRCVYDEGAAVISARKATAESVDIQMEQYRADGYPVNYGLGACGVVVRRHNKMMRRFNLRWWIELMSYKNYRDQLCFNFSAWAECVPYAVIPGHLRQNEYVKLGPCRDVAPRQFMGENK